MKTCLCCGASCSADASSCPACGESSWGESAIYKKLYTRAIADVENLRAVASAVIDDSAEPAEAPETPNNAAPSLDPPTLVDAPKGRRSARRS